MKKENDAVRKSPLEFGLTVDGDLVYVLGLVTVLFEHLAMQLEWFIWALVGEADVVRHRSDPEIGRAMYVKQRVGQAITHGLSFRRQIEVAVHLAAERFSARPDLLIRVDALRKRLGHAEERRNRLTHSVWARGSGAEEGLRLKTASDGIRGVRHKSEGVALTDLYEAAEDLTALRGEIIRLILEVYPTGEAPLLVK